MLRLHIALQKLKSWWIIFIDICIYIALQRLNQTRYQRTPFEALHNYFMTISDGLPPALFLGPISAEVPVAAALFQVAAFPHPLALDPIWGCQNCHSSSMALRSWMPEKPATVMDVRAAPMWPMRTSQTSSAPMITSDTWLAAWKITDFSFIVLSTSWAE